MTNNKTIIAEALANIICAIGGIWLLWSALGWKVAIGAFLLAMFVVRPNK